MTPKFSSKGSSMTPINSDLAETLDVSAFKLLYVDSPGLLGCQPTHVTCWLLMPLTIEMFQQENERSFYIK